MCNHRFIGDLRVYLAEFNSCRLRLGSVPGHIRLIKQHLALQVTQLHEVAVNQPDKPDACPSQGIGQHGSKGADATQEHSGPGQLLLPCLGDA